MNPEATKPDAMDAILANEEDLVPSSGFLARVMERVQEEAEALPPIPFPWKRAVPGMILAVGVLGWSTAEIVRYALHEAGVFTLPKVHIAAMMSQSIEQAGWIVVAFGLSTAAWVLSRRVAGRSGLL